MSIAAPSLEDENSTHRWAAGLKQTIFSELRKQRRITAPLIPMNLTWFLKTTITTAFLGRLGELQLAAGTLGFTFANVTGFSVLTGLCWAMEPICGQAHGAKNHKLLHKTLLMSIILLLVASIPISLLWIYTDTILILFGQQREIAALARTYVKFLLPDLVVTSFLCPLKSYLSSQGITLPIMVSSAVAIALHVPFNMFLSKAIGLEGVSVATWLTDLVATVLLASYMAVTEITTKAVDDDEGGGWWDQRASEWGRLIRLSLQCCFTGCLEWWCYEILVLLAGRLPDPKRAVVVLTVVLNFDYLLYAVMVSLATGASTRVSNELGAGDPGASRDAAYVSLGLSFVVGCAGGSAMVALRGHWGYLFSHEEGVVVGSSRMLLLMAVVEVFNFPVAVCGGIFRGTSRPWLGMCSVGGFYMVGLPLAVGLAFKVGLGLGGLLMGFGVGSAISGVVLGALVSQIDWVEEARRVKSLAGRVVGDAQDLVSELT